MSEARLYRGMRDFLPNFMIPRERILEQIRKIFQRWGYVPIETPAIELLSTLLGKYGDDADKLIYRLEHSDGLGLRYDLTVPLARVIALYKQDLPKPFRRYQIQPVWRAERAQKQKGRFREFIQCDVDIIGTSTPIADAEIIAISAEILKLLGFKDFQIILNHRKILRGLVHLAGFDSKDEISVLRSLDKWDKIGENGVMKELDSKGYSAASSKKLFELVAEESGNWEMLANFAKLSDERISEGVLNIQKILEHLSSLGVGQDAIKFSPRMARGLDYYTGAIFEASLPELPNMGSLTGGGRYDNLIGMFSKGEQIPACGTTIGIDRILAAMDELNLIPDAHTNTKVMVAMFSDELAAESLTFAQKLRKIGIETEVFPEPKKLGKQFAYADKWKIPYVIIIGEDEAKEGLCLLKELSSGQQRIIKTDDAIRILVEVFGK